MFAFSKHSIPSGYFRYDTHAEMQCFTSWFLPKFLFHSLKRSFDIQWIMFPVQRSFHKSWKISKKSRSLKQFELNSQSELEDYSMLYCQCSWCLWFCRVHTREITMHFNTVPDCLTRFAFYIYTYLTVICNYLVIYISCSSSIKSSAFKTKINFNQFDRRNYGLRRFLPALLSFH